MAVDFSKSKTRENLMRAFAGESQARNRYTIAAKQASRDNLYSISQIFLFTADQERAHAEVFYELLRGQTEQTIEICGGYPVNLAENVTDLLKSAVHNEMQEFEDVYPQFSKIAKEEGFDQAAGAFDMIAYRYTYRTSQGAAWNTAIYCRCNRNTFILRGAKSI